MSFLWNKAAIRCELLCGDELLHLVNGDRSVDFPAHAGVFAATVADASANGGQRVFKLDQLQRLAVFPLGGKLEIALHGDMRGAVGLAGGGAALDHILAVQAVLCVPFILRPVLVPRGDGCVDVLHHGRFGAELLAQLQRVDRAVFHALSAGDAFAGVHLGDIVGAHHIHVLKHSGGAERKAPATAAIADSVRLAAAVGVGDLVHEAVFLRTFEDFIRFPARDLPSSARADIVLRRVTHLNAHILLEVSAALAHDLAVRTAGAGGHGEDIVLLQVGGDFLIACAAALAVDCTLNRDDAHEPHADGERAGAHRPAHTPVGFHCIAHDGILLHDIKVIDDHFHRAGNPGLRPEVIHTADVVDKAAAIDGEFHELLVAVFLRLADDGGNVRRRLLGIRAQRKADFTHLVRHARLEDDIFRIIPAIAALVACLKAGFFAADYIGKRNDVFAVLADIPVWECHLRRLCHAFSLPCRRK
ncbi:hypothetical protein SDC9_104913 [bioreactor metagenome]|uniref:Uncharacterized protein n=1 Tax=bioreactor metagenome TaxID=1076179 RepID=A0A645B8S2_9ZZZZ